MIELKRQHGGTYVVEPLGWRVDGLLGPIFRNSFGAYHSLLCSPSGIVVARMKFQLRYGRILYSDTLSEVTPSLLTGDAEVFPLNTIDRIELRTSFISFHRIFIHPIEGRKRRWFLAYRRFDVDEPLLKRLYGERFHIR